MSFSVNFYRYDSEVMSLAIGSGDSSVKAAIDNEFARRTSGRSDSEWELGRQLAHRVVDQGLQRFGGKEQLRHRLAAQWLTSVFRVPGHCEAADWRWRAFYDTIHTVPGFEEPIREIIGFLDEGRPFFGSECPDEADYGYLQHEESCHFLAQCQKHRAEFEADEGARYCIGNLLELFEYATREKYDLWFGFW